MIVWGLLLATGLISSCYGTHLKARRSIDLSASHTVTTEPRLPPGVIPQAYVLELHPNINDSNFRGVIRMNLLWNVDTKKISLHAHHELKIDDRKISLRKIIKKTGESEGHEDVLQIIPILRADHLPRKTIYVIYLKELVKAGSECELKIEFEGQIWENTAGLFKGSYSTGEEKNVYLATNMRTNNARRLFPCFDEPHFKVPYNVSISRPKTLTTIFNTPLLESKEISNGEMILDSFETTPPISSFTFGFVISRLKKVECTSDTKLEGITQINIWGRPEVHTELQEIFNKILKVYSHLTEYFNVSIPISKIDFMAIPGLSLRPTDNWGLLLFKESVLLKSGYSDLTQEIVYQWIGSWVTPRWWNDAHLNKALASFLAADTALKINEDLDFTEKYPMTILYSVYYEYSKRYPHSRITGMKQETISFRIELILRMLNYTLCKDKNTFKTGIQKFIENNRFGVFSGDDLWNVFTEESIKNGCLKSSYNVSEIVRLWIAEDRLPVVSVHRNYEQKTANVQQKVYLRERPHDVPDQDKMLWWIPLILVTQKTLDFYNTTPVTWVEKMRQTTLQGLPTADEFIIINPEEIGPFPVNYDERNWNLLANFMLTNSGRKQIPPLSRAKLLHDAWCLAYAGDLSFATAFNMTLFMEHERNHLVWNPVFTFIDHIGRHIDMSSVHKKFEAYVRILLAPLYEELINESPDEPAWKTDLRSLAKTFVCRVGYKPCIVEAQSEYKKWMERPNTEIIPVPNQYVCPVLKWGNMEEWEFGFQHVINFPKSRSLSERTYILKMLASCPAQEEKIMRLLDFTVLQTNETFTENDILLIFRTLSTRSIGYMTLVKFLDENWNEILLRFKSKTNLWDGLVNSATGSFTTQEGYDMVMNLHNKYAGKFGSAEHIIEKSLKNIKEETKWSQENLPVIELWLDQFLAIRN